MKKYFLIFLILIISVSASYNIGNDYNVDESNFNSALVDFDLYTKTLTDPYGIPLDYDIDNDGDNEIIVLDDGNIRLYQGKTLAIVDAVSVYDSVSSYILYDLDGDNYTEIIIGDNTGYVKIVEYNGTAFNVTSLPLASHGNGSDILIGCSDINECVAIYGSALAGDTDIMYGSTFTNTGIVHENALKTGGSGDGSSVSNWCFSNIPVMQIGDIEPDGVNEFISSWTIHEGAKPTTYIMSVSINGSDYPVLDDFVADNIFGENVGAYTSCFPINRNYYSSPLLYDFDGSPGNGLEVVLGVQEDADEFKIYYYDNDLDFRDTHPELFQADGIIISNPILMSSFPDTGQSDFCVLGFEENDGSYGQLDLICGSRQTGELITSQEFFYDLAVNDFNFSESGTLYNNMIHATQVSASLTDGTNLNEILTTFGTFSLDLAFDDELLLQYSNPKDNSAVIISDHENVNLGDMILYSGVNIWYIDDKFVNQPAQIDEYYINPCIDGVWKQNTSVEVRSKVIDEENEQVRARFLLYNGETFVQDSGWSDYSVSGTTFVHSFIANVTISLGKLIMQANDISNNETVDQLNFTFSVGVNGVSYGDCITSVTGLIDTSDTSTTTETPDSEPTSGNAIDETVSLFTDNTNLGTTITWLLFMLVMAMAIWFFGGTSNIDEKSRLIVIALIEIVMLIIGVKLSYISAGVIWTFIILSLMGIGLTVSSKFFHGNRNNGGV